MSMKFTSRFRHVVTLTCVQFYIKVARAAEIGIMIVDVLLIILYILDCTIYIQHNLYICIKDQSCHQQIISSIKTVNMLCCCIVFHICFQARCLQSTYI